VTKLVIVCGLSFGGKSTLAKAIRERLGHREVDVDATKVRLHGGAYKGDADLSHDEWDAIYAATDAETAELLAAGVPVVDGSRNFRRFERDRARAIAEGAGVPLVTVYVDTPAEVARERHARNAVAPTRVHMSEAELEEIIGLFEPPSTDEATLVFRFAEDVDQWIVRNRDALT
jgi:predicted kinase